MIMRLEPDGLNMNMILNIRISWNSFRSARASGWWRRRRANRWWRKNSRGGGEGSGIRIWQGESRKAGGYGRGKLGRWWCILTVTAWATGAPLSAWGADHAPPLLSREPLVVESRARRHSKALHKTRQNHLRELKIEVKCEVKVRLKVKIWRFDILGPGDQDYRT